MYEKFWDTVADALFNGREVVFTGITLNIDQLLKTKSFKEVKHSNAGDVAIYKEEISQCDYYPITAFVDFDTSTILFSL